MQTLKIEANYRTDMSKSRIKAIRKQGYVTGSVFGHNAEPVAIELKLENLVEQTKNAEAGLKSLIDLKIKDAPNKADGTVILKDFYKDPLTKKVLDVQFQRVNLKEKIHIGVPIVAIGEAPGTKDGGVLEQQLDELQVSCLPTNIPPRIDVDVSGLNIGHHINAGDIDLGEDVEILTDPVTTLFACVITRAASVETEEEAAAEEAPAEPEAEE